MQFLAFLAVFSLFASFQGDVLVQPAQGVSANPRLTCPIKNNVVFCQPNVHRLKTGTLLKTLPKLGKEWNVSLEFKPTKSTHLSKQANIIHLSILGGGNNGRMTTFGGRIVTIWTMPDQDLYFSSALVNQHGEQMNWNNQFNGTVVGKWTSISVSQQGKKNKEGDCAEYKQEIKINGKTIFQRTNTGPKEFASVKVFASNPDFPAQPGFITNFVIQEGNTGHI